MLRINQTKKCEAKDSSLRINFVLEPRDRRFPGSLSLSHFVGHIGENPGNEVAVGQGPEKISKHLFERGQLLVGKHF